MTDERKRFVGYFRISGQAHGRLRADLEEQRAVLRDFALVNGAGVIAECVDYENGSRATFLQLQRALKLCADRAAVLVLPRMGLLVRDWRFMIELHRAGVDVVAVDVPEFTRETIGKMAVEARRNDRRLPPELRDPMVPISLAPATPASRSSGEPDRAAKEH